MRYPRAELAITPAQSHASKAERKKRPAEVSFAFRWLFETTVVQAGIEESIFFAAPDGPRSCAQIVVHGETGAGMVVEWSFRHVERKPPRNEA
jgi:uncharacterized heparinase superfamily protein